MSEYQIFKTETCKPETIKLDSTIIFTDKYTLEFIDYSQSLSKRMHHHSHGLMFPRWAAYRCEEMIKKAANAHSLSITP